MLCAKILKAKPRPNRRPDAAPDGWLDRLYAATLRAVLEQKALTLLATAATLILTIELYVAIPKGFLPAQDTGLLTATLEASPDISFEALSRLQARVTELMRGDRDVAGVTSILGVGPMNPAPNVARLSISLRNRKQRAPRPKRSRRG